MAAGGLSGTMSWVVTYPLDVVKSRLQANGMEGRDKYHGIYHCFKTSIQSEGLLVMFRGLMSTVVRAFPTNAATFTVVSWVMKLGNGEEQSCIDSAAWKEVLARGEILVTAAAAPIIDKIYPTISKQREHLYRLHHMATRIPILNFHYAVERGI